VVVQPLAETPVAAPGTPEAAWQRWGVTFPTFSLLGCRRLVVVAPHPDDEILGLGGTMAIAAASGIRVDVVAVTDGEASHGGSTTVTPADLATRRPAESLAALAELGVPPRITRLGIHDGAVADHEPELASQLAEIIADDPAGTWCAAPWRNDGHPDHDATGRACALALRDTRVRLVEYPVWMWHWAAPGDASVPWSAARSVRLPNGIARAKRDAVARFASQLAAPDTEPDFAPILPQHVLARLLRATETVFV